MAFQASRQVEPSRCTIFFSRTLPLQMNIPRKRNKTLGCDKRFRQMEQSGTS